MLYPFELRARNNFRLMLDAGSGPELAHYVQRQYRIATAFGIPSRPQAKERSSTVWHGIFYRFEMPRFVTR
jgi:hypothetical protein